MTRQNGMTTIKERLAASVSTEDSDFIQSAAAVLRAAGLLVRNDPRWPYTYHHDFSIAQGRFKSRADAAKALTKRKETKGSRIAEAGLILGAISQLISQAPLAWAKALAEDDNLRHLLVLTFSTLPGGYAAPLHEYGLVRKKRA